jgi:cellulase (glycosyl hydrolase family 5)
MGEAASPGRVNPQHRSREVRHRSGEIRCPPCGLPPIQRAVKRQRPRLRGVVVAVVVVASAFAAVCTGSSAAAVRGNKFKVSTQVGNQAKLGKAAALSGQVAWTASPVGANVSKVVFSIDGVVRSTDLATPYRFNGDVGLLDTTTLSDGPHTFDVNAYAADGRTAGASLKVRVYNGNVQAPFTVGSSIGNGATLSGSSIWTATPTGATASEVDFKIDGAAVWSDRAAPYQFNGDPTGLLDTSTVAAGAHLLEVVATSTDGRIATASSSVTVASAASESPPPSPSAIPADVPQYGFSLGGRSLFRSAADRAFELDQIQAAANGHRAVVRIDSTPSWQPWLDTWVSDALARNLEPMLILFGNNGPVSADAAASFAAAQGAKWKGKVRLFELANEPDLNGWTPEQYTADLKAAYVALKTANPNAIMVAGGLWKWDAGATANPSGGAREWVRRMYAAGAKGYFDMLSLHFYDDPDDHGTWNLWDQAFSMSTSIRSIMDANGDQAIPIASTESGGPTTKYGEAGQATIVDHDFNHLYSGQIRMLLVYTMLDDDVPGFGMLRDDRTRRPAWYAFQQRAA